MLKAVIFDMDGVIIDSEPLHAKAVIIVCKKFGITVDKKYCYRFIGTTNRSMFETICKDFNLDANIDDMLKEDELVKEKLYKEEGFTPVPFVIEFIKNLYENNIILAIASSSDIYSIKNVVKQFGIEKYFTKLISGTTVKNSKPAPDIFLKAIDELGINNDECIIIEDSMNGVLAANSANIPSIGFINPNSGKQDLSKASILIESFENINYDFVLNTYNRYYNIPITIAETKRLIIRELSINDIDNLYAICQKEEIKKYIDYMNEPLEIEKQKHIAYIKNVYHFCNYGFFGVFEKSSNTLIGKCGAQNKEFNNENIIELGYLIDISFQKKGYAKEALKAVIQYMFNNFDIDQLYAFIDISNIASINTAKSVGMKQKYVKDHYVIFSIENKLIQSKNTISNNLKIDYDVYSKKYKY